MAEEHSGLEAQSDKLIGRVASFEKPASPITLVNASVACLPFGPEIGTRVIMNTNNNFDVIARRHARPIFSGTAPV